EGQRAVTHVTAVRRLREATLVRVRLETGRTHQIRVHLAAIGLPVVGDPVYGTPEPRLGRQFLHAARLAFAHPVTGEQVEVVSPLPPDLGAALERARTS
ncbi:MAG TPA: pseudouridine synthase, partial [Gemmatimonadales bacterium]|nr:pseudouridine synthase [Gemmatimonadales bacterium]